MRLNAFILKTFSKSTAGSCACGLVLFWPCAGFNWTMGSLPVWEQIVRKMMVDEDDINSDPSPLGNCI